MISKKVCRICKQTFHTKEKTCVYHTGRWLGAELSKHYGTRSGGNHTGLALFWDCCDSEDPLNPGCQKGYHKSYDDSDDSNKQVFMNIRQ